MKRLPIETSLASIVLLLAFLLPGGLHTLAADQGAKTNRSTEPPPQLVVKPAQLDLGKITEGSKKAFSVELWNTGEGLLEIGKIAAECGCTAAILSKNQIQPKSRGELQITFDSRALHGKVEKHVAIPTNDPRHRIFDFVFYAEVVPASAQ